jgi:hypothetical protein
MPKLDPKKEPGLYPDAWARFERAVDVVAKRQLNAEILPRLHPQPVTNR